MKLNVNAIGDVVKRTVSMAPIELVECVFFFVLYECSVFRVMPETDVMERLAFFPIVFFVTLAANTFFRRGFARLRWVYFASVATILPVMALSMKPYVFTTGYFFGILLSVFLVLLSVRSNGNMEFARNLTKLVVDIAFSALVTVVSALVLCAIFGTISFIFNFWTVWYRHVPLFLYLVVLPMVFSYFRLSKAEGAEWSVPKFVNVLINFIVCPAVIIYTAILYAYLVKIAIMWELPKGGLAAMILAFYIVALGGKLFQYVAPKKYYSWFYDNFQYISLPLMILFWTGLVYRIKEYSFTESRVYLVVAGVAMLLFSVMMMSRRFTNFRLMLIIASAVITVSTYIPGVSAKSVGIRCQTDRMIQLAKSLKAYDVASGKLNTALLDKLPSSSTQDEMEGSYLYLAENVGQAEMLKRYGKYSEGQYVASDSNGDGFDYAGAVSYEYPHNSIDCGDYHYALKDAHIGVENGLVVAKLDKRVLLRERINTKAFVEAFKDKKTNVDGNALTVSNDSVRVVIGSVLFDGKSFGQPYDCYVFAKKPIEQ